MPVLCTLHELNEEALVDILVKPKNALCSQYKKYFELDGVELEFGEDALLEIARIAINQRTGARGLRSIMEKFMLKIMYNIPDLDNIRSCHITADVVSKGAEPDFILSSKSSNKRAAITR